MAWTTCFMGFLCFTAFDPQAQSNLGPLMHIISNTKVSCGRDMFDEPEGRLSSPGYPHSTPDHPVSCQYIISVKSGLAIALNFSDKFHIESAAASQGVICPHHWLQVTIPNREPFKLCGDRSPGVVDTNSNRVTLDFHTDDKGLSKGWSMDYSTRRVKCPHPGRVTNGRVPPLNTDFFYRDSIFVRCDKGYTLVMDGKVLRRFSTVCQENGKWRRPLPECKVMSCEEPEKLQNGWMKFLSGSLDELLSVIQYGCDSPFYSLGDADNVTFTCEEDGKWRSNMANVVTPSCKPVCGRPTKSVFASSNGSRLRDDVPEGASPWLARLFVGGMRASAIVIGDRWLMTAAHCLVHHDEMVKTEHVQIYVGLESMESLDYFVSAASFHIHPSYYHLNGLNFDHDIALIKLKEALVFNASVMPLCLPTQDVPLYLKGTMGVVSGFGILWHQGLRLYSRNQLHVHIPVIDDDRCRASRDMFARNPGWVFPDVTDNMFCAGHSAASRFADVVLSCEFVDDSVGPRASSAFSRSPATLILREVFVSSDESLEALTPFVPPPNPDPRAMMFESKAFLFRIPNVDVLLHADCNEQAVMCQISRYTSQDLKQRSGSEHFLVSIDVEGGDFGTLLILRAVPPADDQSSLMHSELSLPLSLEGTLLTEVSFLVFSTVKSMSVPLRGAGLLNCGFKHQGMSPDDEVHIEWRQQYRGRGEKIIKMAARLNDSEGGAEVHHRSEHSSVDGTQVVSEGNASLTLNNLKVTHEGAYICSVTIGPFHGQQVVNLLIVQAPSVSLSQTKLVLKRNTAQTLSCHCSKYYPLEAKVEWLSQSPTDEEPTLIPNQGSLSSHRKHGDGTYSLSSHLAVPLDLASGTRITCRVSHQALDAPVSVSVLVEHPEPDAYWWILSFLGITVVFFYQLLK